jgi:hypothetical protein
VDFLLELWLPILLSAVLVFAASSVIHMATPMHKGDHKGLPEEARLLAGLREAGLAPGSYVFPYVGSMKEMATPETMARYQQGPVGFATVLPSGPPAIGKSLVQWFLFSLLVSACVAYLANAFLATGTPYLSVFRLAGTVAFLAYGFGQISDSIWKGQSWGTTLRYLFDALVYALLTAGVFGWRWPAT